MASRRAEKLRLKTTRNNSGWKKWGPYLSERQWGTVREDYSDHGYAWGYLTHDMARSRTYRWGEEGIAGLSDNKQHICFGFGFWNEKDPIIKERLYGLSNGEGNHGEDVKELYYYLDSSPTHSYMKMLYKYPQQCFPYQELVNKNRQLTRHDAEYEIWDTGAFANNKYFDIYMEYAKAAEDDILIKCRVINRSSEEAPLHIIPQIWFRNTWAWGYDNYKPEVYASADSPLIVEHRKTGNYYLYYDNTSEAEALFCENETNVGHFGGKVEAGAFYKDGVNNYIVNKQQDDVNPNMRGTKAALHYKYFIPAGGEKEVHLRLSKTQQYEPFGDFNEIFNTRLAETDYFYDELQKDTTDEDLKKVQRQAYAGMLWNKQFYHYNVNQWLVGDPASPPLPESRQYRRNKRWRHLVNDNVISMPDKWEYPWYAAWDLAFHTATLAKLDAAFAKRQLLLLLREYYMHPNGQIPAYEWSFSDVNPPVHAWGAWQVYQIDKKQNDGVGDTDFLARVFLKLQMNFTWWVNQKDTDENNLFDGGFLGLDNIGVFDRSNPLPNGGKIEQSDATAWMAMYALNMLRIAIELSKVKPYYQEMASKYFEHFLSIAGAMINLAGDQGDLWDAEDEFYYDIMHVPHQPSVLLKVRSLVGLLPLFAVEIFPQDLLREVPDFTRRLEKSLKDRPDLSNRISRWFEIGANGNRMLSLVRVHRMKCILQRMLDEAEFLSDYGIRALSKFHEKNPYKITIDGNIYSVSYIPGESDSSMFGGNSNWRGPIWFPVNHMLVESLEKFHSFYGDEFRLEFPSNSGHYLNLQQIAQEIRGRLINIFKKTTENSRVAFGKEPLFKNDDAFTDHVLFYEYFNGDDGSGLGASHQTGWTGLVANMIEDYSKYEAAYGPVPKVKPTQPGGDGPKAVAPAYHNAPARPAIPIKNEGK
jgi:hypothetical protein